MTDAIKVGDLARRTGMSVRTLHHYHEIGILSPTRRTPAGHRLYGKDEVERLQRIVSLRRIGLSLASNGCWRGSERRRRSPSTSSPERSRSR